MLLRERENSSVHRNRTDAHMHTRTHMHTYYIHSTYIYIYIYDRAQVDRWFIRKVNYRLALYGVRIRETGLTISPTSTIQNLYQLSVCNCSDLHNILYTVQEIMLYASTSCSFKKYDRTTFTELKIIIMNIEWKFFNKRPTIHLFCVIYIYNYYVTIV